MTKLLLAAPRERLGDAQLAELDRLLGDPPRFELVITRDRARIEASLPDIEILAGIVPYAWIGRMPKLAWFQLWGAGVDWLERHPEARRGDYLLTNATGIHDVQIAEHVFALLLALTRRLPAALRAQARGGWYHADRADVAELAGGTMVVFGFGAIGRRVARLAAALDMRVIAVKRTPAEAPSWLDRLVTADELARYLPEADALVVTVPLTADTRGAIGPTELALLPRTAFLVNVGRGAVVDEAALVDALREGRLAGAGLDVFATEPLPPASPLRTLDNVVVTGHYAGESPWYDERAMAVFLDNLGRYLAGAPMRNVVDKALGY